MSRPSATSRSIWPSVWWYSPTGARTTVMPRRCSSVRTPALVDVRRRFVTSVTRSVKCVRPSAVVIACSSSPTTVTDRPIDSNPSHTMHQNRLIPTHRSRSGNAGNSSTTPVATSTVRARIVVVRLVTVSPSFAAARRSRARLRFAPGSAISSASVVGSRIGSIVASKPRRRWRARGRPPAPPGARRRSRSACRSPRIRRFAAVTPSGNPRWLRVTCENSDRPASSSTIRQRAAQAPELDRRGQSRRPTADDEAIESVFGHAAMLADDRAVSSISGRPPSDPDHHSRTKVGAGH